ncbi:MAG: endolytic transglycosylase MltG [Acutalibacteraceae bacterium]|jgi:UPF0755 protein|nr:endolytic transglycosylase MltG [Clostridiales bacterium]
MNNNDTGKGRISANDEFDELLKRYEVSSKSDQEKSQSNHQKKEKFNLTLSFDDDIKPSENNSASDNKKYNRTGDNSPRYKGEVYFDSRPNTNKIQANLSNRSGQDFKKQQRPTPNKSSKSLKKSEDKKAFAIHIAILCAISILLSIWAMSCLNDIIAFNKKEDVITVTIPENAKTSQIIGILHKEKLIKNKVFCRSFMRFTLGVRKANPQYLSGVYYLRPDMGVEKMLIYMQPKKEAKTITITFPEGWTIDKMAERLEKNGICNKRAFLENLDKAMFDYDFVKDVKKKKDRYHNLEGYLFPDTYEFFVGDNPSNVIRTMLKRFNKEWTPKYDARAKELGLTVDEVITLASIIQKEAGSSAQMGKISSVFHNRLKDPANYPSLQSDATAHYVTNCVRYGVDASQYDTYLRRYNTYNVTGFPVGAICNPGSQAIEAALYPESTDYFYFCHNEETKEVFFAKTLMEHNQNKIKAKLTSVD